MTTTITNEDNFRLWLTEDIPATNGTVEVFIASQAGVDALQAQIDALTAQVAAAQADATQALSDAADAQATADTASTNSLTALAALGGYRFRVYQTTVSGGAGGWSIDVSSEGFATECHAFPVAVEASAGVADWAWGARVTSATTSAVTGTCERGRAITLAILPTDSVRVAPDGTNITILVAGK